MHKDISTVFGYLTSNGSHAGGDSGDDKKKNTETHTEDYFKATKFIY